MDINDFKKRKCNMNEISVSVTCTNCGCPVILRFRTETSGGFCQCCYNCSGSVTGDYSCDYNGNTRIYRVKTHGGAKR